MVNISFLHMLVFIISFHECLSPKATLFMCLIFPLSHDPSLMFYDVPWSMHIIAYYKYCIVCITSSKLVLCNPVLDSSLLALTRRSALHIRVVLSLSSPSYKGCLVVN